MFKLFKFLKPYSASIGVVLALMFLQSLSQLYLPTLMSDIIDTGVIHGDIPYIAKVGAFMLVVAAAGTVCNVLAGYASARTTTGFGTLLRGRLFSQVERFTLHEFDNIGTASLITRTTNDITQVQQVLFMMLRMFVSAPMMCIGGIVMAVSKDAALSLVLVAVIPVIAGAFFLIAGKGVPLFKMLQTKLDRLNLVLRENLTGIRVIRAFNRTDHERERFHEANRDLTATAVKVTQIMSSMMPVMMLVMNVATIAIMWFGSIRVDQNHIQIGDLMAFIQYGMQIMFSMMMFSMILMMIPRASVSADRINAVLNTVPEIEDRADAKTAEKQLGFLEFRHVTFSYPGAEQPAVRDISFGARPGEVTAIIGGTGSGKSTLANLLLRFYDADSGNIFVDGVDIRDMSQESLRAQIGYVPQKAVLFSGTVKDNIRFGKETATDEEVRRAAETAQAADFISAMQDGFDSVIAQGGTNLSGGQKQRLSIARALVRKPNIYMFDDSFSALDFKTDAKLRAALKKETADATVLIVAQRVSTIMDADRIVVLDDGQIAGIGSHEELLRSCGVYREIVASQLSEEEIA
ncbi:multidrug ABC transporter ATP-binding protein [Gordoniibacillus kamchatkensis]|uniref:Multidrug ABC transporter ATP-binding protein n=1 Tax=Gordoniibacillus kamchatkensis TaxID=1590651 RepID=A0ABR5ACN6_9BACL|nr:ABC transporter ATP-binding protein [Paenibacillus sp. VKM B-2647]KIL38762.1 multidrug ABC transporter ATP-binding protein [Paenibacillus sp. VKM B-2647]